MTASRLRHKAAVMAILLTLMVFSSQEAPLAADPPARSDPFPSLPALEGNVDFWVRVFSEWTVTQAAVHDLDHPALVFEIVDLPGPAGDRYTEEQRDFTESVRDGWSDWLEDLEERAAHGSALDDLQAEWLVHIDAVIGRDNLEDIHERVRTQRGLRERFRAGLERSQRWDDRIRAILNQAGLPEDLAYLPHVESSFQPGARSSAGATGLWQFTRGTGRRYMTVNSAIDERLDPIAATGGAAGYLQDAYDQLGSWPLALTSYNHGVGGMLKAKKKFGNDFERIYSEYKSRTFGFASRNFYAEFLAAREVAQHAERYFPEGYQAHPALEHDAIEIDRRASASNIAAGYGVPLDDLTAINPGWSRRTRRGGLALPEGTLVWLPAGTVEQLTAEGRRPDLGLGGWVDETGYYVVQRGDSLSSIAVRHRMSVGTLREMNGIPARSSLIRVGQRLIVGLEGPTESHVVGRGETLSEIAAAHGTTVGTLRRLNGMDPGSSLIRAGQRLRVPAGPHGIPSRPSPHVVRRGETLSEIAAQYRTSVAELRRANRMAANQSVIRVGQRLELPGGSSITADRRHVVTSGDTLLEIAGRYGVRLVDLLTANTLTTRSVIHPGQTLRIPGP